MSNLIRHPFVTIFCPSSGLGLKKDALIIKNALDFKKIPNKIRYVNFGYIPRNILEKFFLKILVKTQLILDRLALLCGTKKKCMSLHLEVMMHRNIYLSPINILIPNQEWTALNPLILEKTDIVWCKSKLSETIFSELGFSTQYIGFQSIIDEIQDLNRQRKREFFTRIGMTKTRGSDQLVELWSKHPEWPTLNMVIDESLQPSLTPHNVSYIRPITDDKEYISLVNSYLFHIYVTEAEGFGHSIVESMSTGAVVLVTNAPPMNEYANDKNAIMINAVYAGQMKLSPRFKSSDAQIESAITKTLKMDDAELIQIRRNAININNQLAKKFVQQLESAVQFAMKK